MTDPLTDRLRSLEPSGLDVSAIDPAALAHRGRARRRRQRAAVATAVLVVIAAAVVIPLSTSGSHRGTSRLQTVATPPVIAEVPTSELVVDGQQARACSGLAPLGVLTEPGGAEKAKTPEAAGLRYVLAHRIEGASGGDWVLLDDHDGVVDFGQRTGAVGISATVELKRKGDVYHWAGSGGCGPVGYADGTSPQVLDTYTMGGDVLTISYEGGSCDTRPVTAHVYAHPTTVDVLVVQPPPPKTIESCGGVGLEKSVTVALTDPLGTRTVRDIAYLPVRVVPSAAAERAQSEQDDRAIDGAETLCDRAAGRAVRKAGDSDYPVDVAVVRKDVPAAAQAWRSLPASKLAALCYEDNGDHTFTQLVATAGLTPIVLDRHYTAEPLARLPDDHSQLP